MEEEEGIVLVESFRSEEQVCSEMDVVLGQ